MVVSMPPHCLSPPYLLVVEDSQLKADHLFCRIKGFCRSGVSNQRLSLTVKEGVLMNKERNHATECCLVAESTVWISHILGLAILSMSEGLQMGVCTHLVL